ncbi:hypothetical protein E8L99_00470 [Phreatobacter aquaticus]|uniref:Uncharacterized protein n=1 Tax=Phreatobacter aquaticus TaxID=2570229 RepID=A0A4D7QG01_9HYPH|nr:hypothetical protein [Phreatobacter aquaticus]QCK84376.1 hypothetical protein E8L99_00470 [Phreatobacter aquaticus]
MTGKLEDHPLVQGLKHQSEKLGSGIKDAAATHNSAMTTLVEHVLKAQAELYKGQLAILENMIGKLSGTAPAKAEAAPERTRPASPLASRAGSGGLPLSERIRQATSGSDEGASSVKIAPVSSKGGE